jgi:hypothetical protein
MHISPLTLRKKNKSLFFPLVADWIFGPQDFGWNTAGFLLDELPTSAAGSETAAFLRVDGLFFLVCKKVSSI